MTLSRDSQALTRLLAIMQALRAPGTGCPWDLEQTFASIAPHTLEEAFEVADAIAAGDMRQLRDELGDLLFQVVFHAQMAREAGSFDFADVASAIADKLERRHPHVFQAAASSDARDADGLNRQWEAHKQAERLAQGAGGVLDGVARTLPALMRANKLGKRAARVDFEWPDLASVSAKVMEEWQELQSSRAQGESTERQAEELGDLLFALAQYARHLKLDPEAALRAANDKFSRRFAAMEARVAARGLRPEQLRLADWEALWQEVKEPQKT
jgi:ATP diphosphatase